MTWEAFWSELWALVKPMLDLPALVLLALLGAAALVTVRAQARADFDWGEALRDDPTEPGRPGKVSSWRACILGSFAVSSWVVMHDALSPNGVDPAEFWAYLIVWSGAKVADKLAEKWDGALPFVRKGGPTP